MICYCCSVPSKKAFCDVCTSAMIPNFTIMDSLPNICLGGYLYPYNDVVRFILHEVKFKFNFGLAKRFRSYLLMNAFPTIFFESDAIVTVGSHWFRQFIRGPSHINYLFAPILKSQDNFYPNYLIRRQFSRGSYRLNRFQRETAVLSKRFDWRAPPKIKSVTIIDDICTTGLTLSEIARLLKSYGIDNVKVLVVSNVKAATTIRT